MGRQDLQHIVTSCRQGINQQLDLANMEQCADARNVWAPEGRVIARPGYSLINAEQTFTGNPPVVFFARAEDVSAGTFTSPFAGILSLSNLEALAPGVAADRLYLGRPTTFGSFGIVTTNQNVNLTGFVSEYWNGSEWHPVRIVESLEPGGVAKHLSGAEPAFAFRPPRDWTSVTVNGQDAFWIRFSFRYANLSSPVNLQVDGALDPGVHLKTTLPVRGLLAATLNSQRFFFTITVIEDLAVSPLRLQVSSDLGQPFGNASGGAAQKNDKATIATVVDTNEIFIAYDHQVHSLAAHVTPVSTEQFLTGTASVETRDFAVGPGAPYDPNFIAQELDFPQAKYLKYFRNRLWAAGLKDAPHTIKWSAPLPYHRVWPLLSQEPVIEDDNSPITGIFPLQEQMVVFKQDSIWLMVDTGLDANNLQTFTPRKVVSGVGCVSASSIQDVRGRLIFLSEDGVYAFNGTPNIEKVTEDPQTGADRLFSTVRQVSTSRRHLASSANWKAKQVYLLSMSTGKEGRVNDITLVWDYKRNIWWLWDDIDAQDWLVSEGAGDEEVIFFGDSAGGIYQFNVGKNDHGAAILSEVTTTRLGYDGDTKLLHTVDLQSTNGTRDLTVEVLTNDTPPNEGIEGTVILTDPNEPDWGSLQWAVVSPNNYVEKRDRHRRQGFKTAFDWVQARVKHSSKNQPMELKSIDLGSHNLGRR